MGLDEHSGGSRLRVGTRLRSRMGIRIRRIWWLRRIRRLRRCCGFSPSWTRAFCALRGSVLRPVLLQLVSADDYLSNEGRDLPQWQGGVIPGPDSAAGLLTFQGSV